ncbi:MAG: DNA polymerase III subunit delta [Bryobacterales bacterium]|nr:DNA polymerase III subunit delta [Bryobacterales bacterium]
MTSEQFLARAKRKEIAPAVLLIGPESYGRDRCRQAIVSAMLAPEDVDSGLTRHDLAETSLVEAVDDARALSLFAANRVIVAYNAEAALPKGRVKDAEEAGESSNEGAAALARYLEDPSPGVVIVFEAARFDFEGEDKQKIERVRKFYQPVKDVVELKRFSIDDARPEAQRLAKAAGLRVGREAFELMIEALGGDMARIAVEIEKLSVYSQGKRELTSDDIAALVPDARTSTIFALVAALGRKDRSRALQILDTLSRDGEYLPLALAFLSTQFRFAMVAKEAGLRNAQQVQGHFSRQGVPMWGSRAEQVYQTVGKFSGEQLRKGMKHIFEADRDMRGTRPDDRIVMEQFILKLTAREP